MEQDMKVNKPVPAAREDNTLSFRRGTDLQLAIQTLEAGKAVLITEFFNNGLSLLHGLQAHLHRKFPQKSFLHQRVYRKAYQKLSNLIVLEIVGHQLVVKKSPRIGWLEKLYPQTPDFLLSFPQVQGLNSAWQWYQNGISIPVLRNKIHPYYGTYFPTRFEHLLLFDNWLKRYKGPKKSAMDIGFGCGVLSLQMIEQGFQKVYGTEINPNAFVGMKEYMGETKLSRKIELDFGNLFGNWDKATELIVFNPPWLPAREESDGADKAMYYDEKLFPDFFAGAKQRLLPDGKLLLIFSNLAQIAKLTQEHPIVTELDKGGRFQLERCFRKKVKASSTKTLRDPHWRSSEEVELWVLVHE